MYFIEYNCSMDKKAMLEQLGLRVKEVRLQKGLTQTELANKIGKDHPSINKLENGKVNPSYVFLLEVAQGLEVHIKDIIPD
jgi:transcriptional regulator with XRE-family HTH domain